MRVISGIYKRRRFDVPHSFKARPTTDFAKENLFNVLTNNYIDLIILNIHTYVDVFWKNWLDIFVIEVNYVSQLDLLVRL